MAIHIWPGFLSQAGGEVEQGREPQKNDEEGRDFDSEVISMTKGWPTRTVGL